MTFLLNKPDSLQTVTRHTLACLTVSAAHPCPPPAKHPPQHSSVSSGLLFPQPLAI
ncbi:hypothetical protein [Neisseria sp. WF04]|uniref:hypothetical protein n=1 Tax=Neisseria sp. WF04 TaxID=2558283 RepID=UPI00142FCC7B|nr:hypothetical protein [Neisseria sp. WF04]